MCYRRYLGMRFSSYVVISEDIGAVSLKYFWMQDSSH